MQNSMIYPNKYMNEYATHAMAVLFYFVEIILHLLQQIDVIFPYILGLRHCYWSNRIQWLLLQGVSNGLWYIWDVFAIPNTSMVNFFVNCHDNPFYVYQPMIPDGLQWHRGSYRQE